MDLDHLVATVHLSPGAGAQMTLITDTVTIKASTADTGGAFALYETETPPAGGCPPHTERYDDVTYFVLDGTYTVLIGEDEVELEPGGYAFIPRQTLHAYLNPGLEPARMLVLVTPGGIHEQFLDDVSDRARRPAWEPDMSKVLAAAPKYGIEFRLPEDIDRSQVPPDFLRRPDARPVGED